MRKLFAVVAILVVALSLLPSAVIAQEPTEIASMRTEFSETYDLGDGNYRFETGGDVIHWKYDYNDASEPWRDTDLTWNGDMISNAPYILVVNGNSITVTNRRTGGTATLSLIAVGGVAVNPSLGKSKIPSGVAGVDLQITPYANGVAFSRVLKYQGAPDTAIYTIEQMGSGISVRMEAKDADGLPVPVQHTMGGGLITEWIDAKDRGKAKYPITVDPVLTLTTTIKDTHLVSNTPNQSYGSAASIYAGYDFGASINYTPILEFDISTLLALPGVVVSDAAMGVYCTGGVNPPTASWAYKLIRTDWSEGVSENPSTAGATRIDYKIVGGVHFTWTTVGGDLVTVNPIGEYEALYDVPAAYDVYNITAIAQDAYNNLANVEVIIVRMEAVTSYVVFNSRSAGFNLPRLIITYTYDPQVQTNAATYIADVSAKLNGFLLNDATGVCDMRFQYDTDAAVDDGLNTTWVAGFTTGQSHFEVVDNLTDTTQYWFRAQARLGAAIVNGATLDFTTLITPEPPTDVYAYTEDDKVVLVWTRGIATAGTEVRWKLGGYPTSIIDGTLLIQTPMGSATHTGRDYGTAYYYSLYGYSGGNYTTPVYAMITTGAGEGATTTPSLTTPTFWLTTVNYAIFSNMPLYDQINTFSDSVGPDRNVGWSLLSLLICVGVAVFVMFKSKKGTAGVIALAGMMIFFVFLRLLPGFMVAFAIIFFIGAAKLSRPAEGGAAQ